MASGTMPKTYLLYDGRAVGGDTDEAVVLTCSRTLKEARHDGRTGGYGECVIYEYDVTPEGELINERFVEVITEAAMASGRIARLVPEKGFGFIRVDGGRRDEDVFFHRSSLMNVSFDSLTEGQPVTFNLGSGPKGPRAEHVHVTD